MITEIAGFNETAAAALFAKDAHFMLGCQFASLVLDTFLAGVLMMQMHKYFSFQKDDKWWTRAIVIWTAIMNTVVTCYYWAYMSYLFVDNFGRWLPWLEVRWLMLMPTFDVMCVAVVQAFFAHRAFLLMGRNWFILGLISCLILAACGGAIGVTVVFGSQESLLGANKSGPTLITWTATTTAADVLIAASILRGLLKSKSGWAHTDKLITRLVRLTFEAQLPPTCLSIAYVAEWSVTPSSLLGALFQALQCKAYTIGLLFSLNSRVDFTGKINDNLSHNPQVYGMTSRSGRIQSHGPIDAIQVEVETETYITGFEPSAVVKKQESLSDIEEGHKGANLSTTRLTQPESSVPF
ncbi:hypothetical protein DB88DRAFT_495467 [Papiliotrema laurentii]|uniref:DUF6534 domain-containing protein n=1 Tax=Papiliotrema laurentii TaxID=5418 RepID=A0AAD9CVZ5_PAPLA|nr:hypothetical protein DB88DRAFT_495467 [Papiliotrema laurentii]